MNLQFHMPTQMIAEEGAVARHAAQLTGLGRRCLIVTGRSAARLSGALEDIMAALDAADIPWQLYDQIGQNPLTTVCHQGGAAAREFGAEFLVGIGGGSALDATKAVAVYATNPELGPDHIYSGWKNRAMPIALVGTTAGTGSEVVRYAVLTGMDGKKKSIAGPDLFPVISFGDPRRYTASLSREFTVSTALDVMAHATESHFHKDADQLSRGFTLAAMELLLPNLEGLTTPEALPDGRGREEIYSASILAGLAINQNGTCFCHTMSYVLTEEYGVPHGAACAVFLGEFLKLCEDEMTQVFDDFVDYLGTSREEMTDLVDRLLDVELPVLSDEKIEELLDYWSTRKNMAASPGDFNREKQREVARRILQGGK